jgi:predicted nucleic acid-binding protein
VIVIDASVLVEALVRGGATGASARALLSENLAWAAPEHLTVEAFSAVRRLAAGGKITTAQAELALLDLTAVEVDTVPVSELIDVMWDLRHAVSGYDAAFVALARRRNLTLVTADLKLAAAASSWCRVQTPS